MESFAAKELELNVEARSRREKNKHFRNKIDKKIVVPEYHFYENKERLQDLLQKEENHKNNKHNPEFSPLTTE